MGQAKQRGSFSERQAQSLKQNATIDEYFEKAPKTKREMLARFNGNRMTLAAMVIAEVMTGKRK